MDYREELFKALTTGIEGTMRDKHIDALVEVCRVARKEGYNEGYNAGLEDGKKQKEPVFKIGDRVKTLVDKDNLGTEIFPTGTIGEVVGINGDSIAVESYDTTGYGYYRNDTLELANDVFLVGDEVYLLDKNYREVVTAVWGHCRVKIETLTQSGKLSCTDAKDLHRTGRRFPEIANVLKKMQEGKE